MNIQSMRTRHYHSIKVDDASPPEASERARKLELVAELRAEGCSEALALRTIGWSRATYYRWKARYRQHKLRGLVALSRRPHRLPQRRWSRQHEWAVWNLRKLYPFMGRRSLQTLLQRQGTPLSVSTVGRILAKGVKLGRVRPCAFCRGSTRPRRRRDFSSSWAKRRPYRERPSAIGELVQIDHMSVSREGRTLKEFRAVCPISKVMVSRVYSRATAHNASRFLQHVHQQLPFKLRSVQVDGGSEFMADFEHTCQKLHIPLRVLPPRRPQLNGVVERHNDTSRVEFWSQYTGELTVAAVNEQLAEYLTFFNTIRPHQRLDMATPMEYVDSLAA